MNGLKRVLLSALAAPGSRTAFGPFRRGIGTIFMLHRFADPETGVAGHDPEELRRTLAMLRRRGYRLMELGEMFRRLRDDSPPEDLGVAFTLDDGYADQVRIAGPVFAEFDCPATVFVTTGFLDRQLWFWWDRIEYIFEHTTKPAIGTVIDGSPVRYQLSTVDERRNGCGEFTARCKLVPDAEKHAAIDRLAAEAGVSLPAQAPARYAPMTWDELRQWEQKGMSFGPHTVTHPILARTPDAQSRDELSGSWQRLTAEAKRPTPVFCYPNGQLGDFGPREFATLGAIGLEGAVVGYAGYAERREIVENNQARFQVRRFVWPDNTVEVSRFASGFERLLHGTGRIA